MADLSKIAPPVITAQLAASAATAIFGFSDSPNVVNFGDYAEIQLTPAQEDQLAEFIIRQLNAGPGPVRINLGGVALKVLARKYWGYAAGLAGLSFSLGRLLRIKGR